MNAGGCGAQKSQVPMELEFISICEPPDTGAGSRAPVLEVQCMLLTTDLFFFSPSMYVFNEHLDLFKKKKKFFLS